MSKIIKATAIIITASIFAAVLYMPAVLVYCLLALVAALMFYAVMLAIEAAIKDIIERVVAYWGWYRG